jgi:DNA-binding MarR family transcriptional regulator
MTVRQRVKQQRTWSPAVEAAVGVLIAADHLQQAFSEICERHGVTTDQYKVLRILREAPAGGYARGEVAERCIFSRSPDVTRMLDRLTRQGFARRAPDPGDRRCSIATITRAGRALLSRIDPQIAAAARRLTKALSHTQLTQLTRLTEALGPEPELA